MPSRRAHYLRPATSSTVPRSHTVLDVETRTDPCEGGVSQTWRLACAQHFTGHAQRGWSNPVAATYEKPWELWVDIASRCNPTHRHVVWCHNLAFDLRASQALQYLVALGFELEGIALDHGASWARFSRGDEGLMLVDLHSWLPASLHKIAADLGLRQHPLPDDDSDELGWVARCARDVEITRQAVLVLLDWLGDSDLGPWRPTGSGQSHSAWRRRWLTHRPLVHDDVYCLDLEREAAWTGRCEVWRHGDLDELPATELDLDLAYCQIAADCELPSVLVGRMPARHLDDVLGRRPRTAILARVEVATDLPLVPCRHDGHILWPVGEFETVLWDPELRLLREAGVRVRVREAYVYRTAPVLQAAAGWIIDQLHRPDREVPAVVKRALKHWARALIGRCAMRYSNWIEFADAESDDVRLGLVEDLAAGTVREEMQVGRIIRHLGDSEEAPDSLPQIPGWVMSECRRRLWCLMEAAGTENVAYVDTDCLIVTPEGARRLEAWRPDGGRWPMHVKGVYGHVALYAPRMIEVDGQRRMAGIPLTARRQQDGRIAGEVFVSLKESMLRRQAGSVQVLDRVFDPASLDRRRMHLDSGATAAIVIPTATRGCTRKGG